MTAAPVYLRPVVVRVQSQEARSVGRGRRAFASEVEARRYRAGRTDESNWTEKICTVCGILKPIHEFARNKGHKYGRKHRCRACRSVYDATLRATHRGAEIVRTVGIPPPRPEPYTGSDRARAFASIAAIYRWELDYGSRPVHGSRKSAALAAAVDAIDRFGDSRSNRLSGPEVGAILGCCKTSVYHARKTRPNRT